MEDAMVSDSVGTVVVEPDFGKKFAAMVYATTKTHGGRVRKSEVIDGQRVGPGGYKKKHQDMGVDELWEQHHSVARLVACGLSDTEIADELGITSVTVGRIRQLPAVKEKLRMLGERKDSAVAQLPVAKRIKALAEMAIRRMEETLEIDPVDGDIQTRTLQFNVSRDILDRAGHGAIKRTIAVNTHEIVNEQRQSIIMEIKARASSVGLLESADGDTPVIDITPTTEDEEEGEL